MRIFKLMYPVIRTYFNENGKQTNKLCCFYCTILTLELSNKFIFSLRCMYMVSTF